MAQEQDRSLTHRVPLYVRVDRETFDACEKAAAKENRSVANWLRGLLRRKLGLEPAKNGSSRKKRSA